ncbi:MAG: hypothetical protein KGH98_01930 [Candidatus Micrarchaeota archaeon]|nr:hypothetical protein [Candidatus Micrarchaeota archaeon]
MVDFEKKRAGDRISNDKPEFLGAMLTGIASRSSTTAKVHRLFRDGKASERELRSEIALDTQKIVAAQKGFAFVSGGQLDWLDLFRPITECFTGFRNSSRKSGAFNYSYGANESVGPVTRWFRTNTFYRKPHVDFRIDCAGYELAEIMPDVGRAVLFLPGPYSFARLVDNSFYNSDEALAIDYSKAIAKSSEALRKKGYSCILLVEHSVGFDMSTGTFKSPDWFGSAISAVKDSGTTLGISFPKAEAGRVVGLADGTEADFVGIDALYTEDLRFRTEKDLLLGVVDSSNIRVENVADLKADIEALVKSASAARYYIGTNDRLYDVPFDIALRKIGALSEVGGVLDER